jgi:hypothetical protein
MVFAYIALLKGPGGVSQQIFEENRQLARLRFDFRDKPPPMQLADALASSMQTHDDRRVAAVERCHDVCKRGPPCWRWCVLQSLRCHADGALLCPLERQSTMSSVDEPFR